MKLRKFTALLLALLTAAAVLTGCDTAADSGADTVLGSGGKTLRIVSGSENRELEPILEAFAKSEGVRIEMTYQGSLDIMRAAGGGGAVLRRRVARQLPVAGRGGHAPECKACRVHLHHPGGVRHPAEPGPGAGPCGERTFRWGTCWSPSAAVN